MDESLACEAFPCVALTDREVSWCEMSHCPFAHQRRRVHDRAKRDRKDLLEMQSGIQPSDQKEN